MSGVGVSVGIGIAVSETHAVGQIVGSVLRLCMMVGMKIVLALAALMISTIASNTKKPTPATLKLLAEALLSSFTLHRR